MRPHVQAACDAWIERTAAEMPPLSRETAREIASIVAASAKRRREHDALANSRQDDAGRDQPRRGRGQ